VRGRTRYIQPTQFNFGYALAGPDGLSPRKNLVLDGLATAAADLVAAAATTPAAGLAAVPAGPGRMRIAVVVSVVAAMAVVTATVTTASAPGVATGMSAAVPRFARN